ncbi:MAG: TIGR04211 family SH3 domain-containing protein [Pseudomonadota bacterium]
MDIENVKTTNSLWAVLLLLLSAAASAESVYVIDVLHVGVRDQPVASGPSLGVVKSSDKLTVLETTEKYFKVRTPKGDEGWISKGYVTSTRTASLRLPAVESSNKKLRSEIDALKKAGSEGASATETLQQTIEQRDNELSEAKRQQAALQQQLDTLLKRKEGIVTQYRWAIEIAVAIAILLAGLYFGGCRYRCQVRKRFGGLEF